MLRVKKLFNPFKNKGLTLCEADFLEHLAGLFRTLRAFGGTLVAEECRVVGGLRLDLVMVAVASLVGVVVRRVEAVGLLRAEFARELAGHVADAAADDSARDGERLLRKSLVDLGHDGNPRRERDDAAGVAGTHGDGLVESDPHAHGVVLGKSDVPAVGVVVRGSRLAAARVVEAACGNLEARTADVHVLQDVDHQVCGRGLHHHALDLGVLLDDFAVLVLDGLDHVRLDTRTAVGEHRVGRRHLEERCAHGTECEARNCDERGLADAEGTGVVHHVAEAVLGGGEDGGDVLGTVEGTAERHHALEILLGVVRAPDLVLVLFVGVVHGDGRVVHGVAGGGAVIHGYGVYDRLE